jgi:hypothetical protein
VQAENDVSIFNIGQPADVHDEAWTATHRSGFLARGLHVTVCQPKSLADLAQSQSGRHGIPLKGSNFSQRTPELPSY